MADHGNVKMINSKAEWDAALAAAGSKLVVVDFFATWCGPCRFIGPKVVELSKTYTDVVFLKVDVDQLDGLAAELGISAMPTFLLFKNKARLQDELVGANEARLRTLIEKNK